MSQKTKKIKEQTPKKKKQRKINHQFSQQQKQQQTQCTQALSLPILCFRKTLDKSSILKLSKITKRTDLYLPTATPYPKRLSKKRGSNRKTKT